MEDFKHIILYMQYDFIQIRQMIGRKRHNPFNDKDRTNVYFIVPTEKLLEKKLNEASRCIEWYSHYTETRKNEFMLKNYQSFI